MPTSSVPLDVVLPGATVAAMRRVIELPHRDRPRVAHAFSARCDADGTFWAGARDGRARGAVRVSVRGTATDVDGGVRVRGVYGNDPRRAGLGVRVLAGFLAVAVLLTQGSDLVHGRDVVFTVGVLVVAALLWLSAPRLGGALSRPVGERERDEMAAYLHEMFDGCDQRPSSTPSV